MRIGSLFTGAGGLDVGLLNTQAFCGAELAWVSDINERDKWGWHGKAANFLAVKHADLPNLGDITTVEWNKVPPVDVIAGGSPCQDLSTAGERKGMLSGTRSGLWYSMCSAVEVLRPQYVVWENVRGAMTAQTADRGVSALQRVILDLEDLGYGVSWTIVSASTVGAPHKRERVFVLGQLGASSAGQVVARHNADSNKHKLLPTPTVRDKNDYKIRIEPHKPNDTSSTLSRALTHYPDFVAATSHWESICGYEEPAYYEEYKDSRRLNVRFSEWLMGWPAGFITDSGVPRYAQFALIGNGVVPQQASFAIDELYGVQA